MNCLPRRQNQNSQVFWTVMNKSLDSTSSISLPNQTRSLLLIHQTFAAIVWNKERSFHAVPAVNSSGIAPRSAR